MYVFEFWGSDTGVAEDGKQSSSLWCYVIAQLVPDSPKGHSATIFRVWGTTVL